MIVILCHELLLNHVNVQVYVDYLCMIIINIINMLL